MNPEEVIEILRQHALELIEFYDQMSSYEKLSVDESNCILNLCLYLIEQLAEQRWFTSDIIEIYLSGGNPVFMNTGVLNSKLLKNEDIKEKSEFENPPFDLEFFSNLKDLD